jgi:hypothetical protein
MNKPRRWPDGACKPALVKVPAFREARRASPYSLSEAKGHGSAPRMAPAVSQQSKHMEPGGARAIRQRSDYGACLAGFGVSVLGEYGLPESRLRAGAQTTGAVYSHMCHQKVVPLERRVSLRRGRVRYTVSESKRSA